MMKDTTGVIYVHESNLPLAWETSICELQRLGTPIKTQYDKDEDPPSLDASAMIVIDNPFEEPRLHRCFPDSLAGLEAYKQEVVCGIHDNWICPEEGKWNYSYHNRLTNYTIPGIEKPINQIQYIIDTLKDCSYSRRAIAITWKPWLDEEESSPACLQNIQCRVIDGKLQMNVHIRSNDAYRAAYMNLYAFTELQKYIAEQIDIPVGRYCHFAGSYHVYGSCLKELQGFFKYINSRSFEQRTWRTDDPMIVEQFEEARIAIAKSLEEEKLTGRKGL